MKNKGLLFILSGPSGTGKGTVVKELVKLPENEVSVQPENQEREKLMVYTIISLQ